MTEQEWLAGSDPFRMVQYLIQEKASPRKLSLFGVACQRCSRDYHRVADATEERIHPDDGLKAFQQFVQSWANQRSGQNQISGTTKGAILYCIFGNPFRPVTLPPGPTCEVCGGSGDIAAFNGEGWDGCPSCSWTRYAVGTGRQPCPWLTPTVLRLARAAYSERLEGGQLDPARLLILSDAMEEAGCPGDAPSPLLEHLRSSGPHWAGCWAIDLILGEK